jgi:hypothetical protein
LLIEAMKPLMLRTPEGALRLDPGRPVHLAKEQVDKLLHKVPDKVRLVRPPWLERWRELATVTNGLTRDDPRFQPVCSALDRCDVAYAADDWSRFEQAADEVKRIVQGGNNHHG